MTPFSLSFEISPSFREIKYCRFSISFFGLSSSEKTKSNPLTPTNLMGLSLPLFFERMAEQLFNDEIVKLVTCEDPHHLDRLQQFGSLDYQEAERVSRQGASRSQSPIR